VKAKRALILFAVFLVSFSLSLYLTFPFERIVKKALVDRGLNPVGLHFNHFPPEVEIAELPFKGLVLKSVRVKPAGLKSFNAQATLCGGKISAEFNYPLKELKFEVNRLKIEKCPLKLQVKLAGNVDGKGSLDFKGKNIVAGKGKFLLSDVHLKDIEFGIFSFKELNLGNGELSYTVSSKNYLSIKGKLNGKDAEVSVKGGLSYNPKNVSSSYLNLKVNVKVKSGKLSGQKFNFTVRGNVNSLRFY